MRGHATIEDQHFAVVRFSAPPGFTARRARIRLLHDPAHVDECVANDVLDVIAFTGPGPMPPASPLTVGGRGAPSGDGGERIVTVDLTGPTVPPGHDLFVGVRVVATSVNATCIRTCGDYVENDTNWWSHARAAPFAWRAFEDHRPPLVVDMAIEVDGG